MTGGGGLRAGLRAGLSAGFRAGLEGLVKGWADLAAAGDERGLLLRSLLVTLEDICLTSVEEVACCLTVDDPTL